VDPMYPDATNSVDCFTQSCTEEEEFRKYWGGDIPGISEKLDYVQRLGVSAIWVTPLAENVRMCEGGTGYSTGYHGYWVQWRAVVWSTTSATMLHPNDASDGRGHRSGRQYLVHQQLET